MSEYDAKWLGITSGGINGRLLLRRNEVVFEPADELAEKIEIPIDKITDARVATEKDISALKVWLLGPVLGTLWKDQHDILIIDFEDEFGIIQHEAFEVSDIEFAAGQLYEIRKAKKLGGKPESLQEKPQLSKQKQGSYWKCPRCLRLNSTKAKICTRCGNEKP